MWTLGLRNLRGGVGWVGGIKNEKGGFGGSG